MYRCLLKSTTAAAKNFCFVTLSCRSKKTSHLQQMSKWKGCRIYTTYLAHLVPRCRDISLFSLSSTIISGLSKTVVVKSCLCLSLRINLSFFVQLERRPLLSGFGAQKAFS